MGTRWEREGAKGLLLAGVGCAIVLVAIFGAAGWLLWEWWSFDVPSP